ncbi:MAG TPA: porin family protein [Bryobacteraceae bacterium]|nr:porin family protein [Bryobacteraceae bacterium]
MRKLILILLFSFGAASAQSLSVGLLGGAPFTDVVNGDTVNGIQSIAKSSNFTIGPTVQVNLPLSLRVEVDALYRPYHVALTGRNVSSDISAQQWRFPVLLQYRFSAPLIKPFVEAGLSFNHLSGISDAAKAAINSGPGQLLHQSDAGIVLGAGVDLKVPLIRLSGELRYTRQTVSNFSDFSNLNQAEVLFGIHF